MDARSAARAGALLGASAVACGAFGAHALQERLAATGLRAVWDTAAHYHLVHGVALLACAALAPATGQPRALAWAARLFTGGVLVFSGSLYPLALGGPRWLGALTPVGGLGLIAGWLALAAAARSRPA